VIGFSSLFGHPQSCDFNNIRKFGAAEGFAQNLCFAVTTVREWRDFGDTLFAEIRCIDWSHTTICIVKTGASVPRLMKVAMSG
jgi:hypothetical protein